jgi:hypothetical protein
MIPIVRFLLHPDLVKRKCTDEEIAGLLEHGLIRATVPADRTASPYVATDKGLDAYTHASGDDCEES